MTIHASEARSAMKHRFPPVDPTFEDIEVWALVIGRFAIRAGWLDLDDCYTNMWRDWRIAERRDADLMLNLSIRCPACGLLEWWPFEWANGMQGARCGGPWAGDRHHPWIHGCGNIQLASTNP